MKDQCAIYAWSITANSSFGQNLKRTTVSRVTGLIIVGTFPENDRARIQC